MNNRKHLVIEAILAIALIASLAYIWLAKPATTNPQANSDTETAIAAPAAPPQAKAPKDIEVARVDLAQRMGAIQRALGMDSTDQQAAMTACKQYLTEALAAQNPHCSGEKQNNWTGRKDGPATGIFDLQINGDTALAVTEFDNGGGSGPEHALRFKDVDGQWLLDAICDIRTGDDKFACLEQE